MSALGHGPELLAKREDLCGIAAVGNKIRRLAALLGDALAQRAMVVLTTGGVQPDHCAVTAVAPSYTGSGSSCYLSGQQPPGRPETCSARNSPARPSSSLATFATVTAMTRSHLRGQSHGRAHPRNPARHRRPPVPSNPAEGEPGPPQTWPTTHAAPDPFTTCQPDDGMTVSRPTDTTASARHASGKNTPPLAGRPPMSQLTSPAPDSPDRPGRLRIRYRLRRAVQEMNSAPGSPELRILAFSRYYSAGPAPF